MTKIALPRIARLAAAGAALLTLGACVYAPPPGPVAVGPGYGYSYPGYYAAPVVGSVDVGIGGGGYRGGWGYRRWR